MKKKFNFDEDMQQILYKTEEDLGKKYTAISLGKTTEELKKEKIPFFQIRQVANDYNGPNPSYGIQHIKLLYGEDFSLLGAQLIGEGDLERRADVLREILDKKKGLGELAKYSIYGKSLEEELDILNLAAFYGMDLKRNWLTVEKVRELYHKGAFFLDVREEEEHEYARILGSKNIPLRNLMARISEIPKDKDVYVYCRSAHRSLDAVNFLKTLGYERIFNIEGGFIALSYEEYTKDKKGNREKIVNRYHFE